MKSLLWVTFLFLIAGCGAPSPDAEQNAGDSAQEIVTIYTHRHYETDQQLFKRFEENTGIKVNVVNANADELIQKMSREAEHSPADVLITVDAGRLVKAKERGLLQAFNSQKLDTLIPSHVKDTDNYWFGLTKRARIMVYAKDRVQPAELSTYESLTEEQWKERILVRSSSNIYNQSLLASLIAHHGEREARAWARGMVNNFAREPKGNDRDQVKAIMAGEGDVAIINTYYLGKLLNSEDPEEVKAGQSVEIFFPNQDARGAHINVSGAGIARHAPNKENAGTFIEFMASKEVQEMFASANYEYPVNPQAELSSLLASWGDFKEDTLPLTKLGELNKQAVIIFDEAGWK